MGENSGIEWTDHTFNPWSGCQRVSPGCDHCYAAALAKRSPRTFGSWEPGGERKRTSEAYWRQPLAWHRKAEKEGKRARVFCGSMCDVFDNEVPAEWREYLWALILDTPWLDWLLLTKRPSNIRRMLPSPWMCAWPLENVWLGTTVENQQEADRRIPELLAVPARVRFLSCEPLLGPVDLRRVEGRRQGKHLDALLGIHRDTVTHYCDGYTGRIHWVIAGGESGPGARPMRPAWARDLRDQCAEAGVPFFFKQWGEWADVAQMDARLGTLPNLPPADPWGEGPDRGRTFRVGKKLAGALLDGREHREVPTP
jgi:protein gp37